MIKQIMVTTDFSKCGNEAVDYGFNLAKQVGASVILISVIEREKHESIYFIDMKPLEDSGKAKQAETQAETFMKNLVPPQCADVPHTLDAVIANDADEGIDQAVDKYKPDLLIISGHGYSGFKKFLLGSTTDRVLRCVECPVLVIKAKGE